MQLEGFPLSEISQMSKVKHRMISLIGGIEINKVNKLKQILRYRKQIGSEQTGRGGELGEMANQG